MRPWPFERLSLRPPVPLSPLSPMPQYAQPAPAAGIPPPERPPERPPEPPRGLQLLLVPVATSVVTASQYAAEPAASQYAAAACQTPQELAAGCMSAEWDNCPDGTCQTRCIKALQDSARGGIPTGQTGDPGYDSGLCRARNACTDARYRNWLCSSAKVDAGNPNAPAPAPAWPLAPVVPWALTTLPVAPANAAENSR